MTIVVGADTIINVDTQYLSEDLDFTSGNFIIQGNATLSIINCNVIGVLSEANPTLIEVDLGKLVITSSNFNISSPSISPHPDTQSLQYVIRCENAEVQLSGNTFTSDNFFSVGFLLTSPTSVTDNITIANNNFYNFHGVLYLLNSNNVVVDGNLLKLCSYGNIVLIGSDNVINNNEILLSGRDETGNAMDILGSDNISITNNKIALSTCRGIFVVSSNNVTIDSNIITGGITYGIILLGSSSSSFAAKSKHNYALKMTDESLSSPTNNITVTNNVLIQNRYGLSGDFVDTLDVENNYFSQRFEDAATRKFWTDNAVLLTNMTNLTWANNFYKEAFTQVNGGDNTMTQIVSFPVTGGVVL